MKKFGRERVQIMIKEIGHVSFKVEDMEASQKFYIEQMGFRKCFEIMKNPDGGESTPREVVRNSGTFDSEKLWITYIQVSESQFIELFTSKPQEKKEVFSEERIGYLHLALIVDDIHAYRNELATRNVKIDIEPKMGMDGTWQMWIHDPDGNKIECMQYTEKSAQILYRG